MDLAITAAESWKIILFGPIVAALIVLGVTLFSPPRFESAVVIPLPLSINQSLVAAGGVNAILAFKPNDEDSADISSDPMAYKISARNALTGNVTVSAQAMDPSRAQKMLSAFTARLAALVAAQKESTAREIQIKLKAFEHQNELLEKVVSLPLNDTPTIKGENSPPPSALQLTNQIRENQIGMGELDKELGQLKEQSAWSSAPRGNPIGRSIVFPLFATFFLSAMALLAFIFARGAIRKASTAAEFASKLLRLKKAFKLRPEA